MKFLVTWEIHPGKIHGALDYFSQLTDEQEAENMGKDLKLIGRWHDLVSGSGVAIFETDSLQAVNAYALKWNENMDIQVTPVLDDEEAKALG